MKEALNYKVQIG